jgi:hypothetical protein
MNRKVNSVHMRSRSGPVKSSAKFWARVAYNEMVAAPNRMIEKGVAAGVAEVEIRREFVRLCMSLIDEQESRLASMRQAVEHATDATAPVQ